MFGRKKREWEIDESKATPESVFVARRRLIKALGVGTVLGGAGAAGLHAVTRPRLSKTEALNGVEKNKEFIADRKLTHEQSVYRFTNFYEFAGDKRSSTWLCRDLKLEPWKLEIGGLVRRPITLDLDDIKKLALEERVYRFRCVEAWAMTVPWIGVPLASLIEMAEPRPGAKFVSMTSFFDPRLAPRQKNSTFPWPYQEAVRLDEAMNPLAFVAIGLYGKTLQPQNGAPLRVIFPWKYGFKGAKSVVKIKLTKKQPTTFWNALQPQEYGLFGNVNPDKPHPRWSQKTEALIGTWGKRVATQKYNGYGNMVANLYPNDE